MARKLYKHFSEVDINAFKKRWPSFSPAELASKGSKSKEAIERAGELAYDEASLDKLQKLRDRLGNPIIITSAYRSPPHNKDVGGAESSYHMVPPDGKGGARGMAFDVVMANHDPYEFEAAAMGVGFRGIIHYPASGFMHIDTRATPYRGTGTGKNAKYFPKKEATPGFADTEPKRDTVKETLLKPEVTGPLLTLAPSMVGMSQGDGPIQYAFAAVFVIAAIVGIWFFVRARRSVLSHD